MPNVLVVTLLIAVRLTPLAIMLPKVFSSTGARRWGIALMLMFSIAIAPQYGLSTTLDSSLGWSLAMAVLRELVLGLALALGFVVLLVGLFLAGAILSQLSGVSFPDVADPQARAWGDSALQRYLSWFALAVFLVSGGHRQLVEALLDSFAWVPLGAPLPHLEPVPLAGQLLAHSFQSGLRVAAPVAFCLIVSTVLVSVLARTMPSLGAFGLGMSVNLVVLLLVSCLSIEAIATAYQQSWSTGIDQILTAWMGQGGVGHE